MLTEIQKLLAVQKENTRITWDEYFMSITLLISARSPCHRLQVGCVLVRDNRIVSTGYNGFVPGGEHNSIIRDNHEIATIHAEQNAINDAAKRGASTNQCVAYITHYPCINCAKSLIACGVSAVKYNKDYRNDEISTRLLNEAHVDIIKVE